MRTQLSVALCLSTLPLAACGGPDPADYVQAGTRGAAGRDRDANTANEAMAKARSARDVQRLLTRVGADFSEHAAELGTITPPEKVARRPHKRLRADVCARYGRSFRKLGEEFGRSPRGERVSRLQDRARELTRSSPPGDGDRRPREPRAGGVAALADSRARAEPRAGARPCGALAPRTPTQRRGPRHGNRDGALGRLVSG